MNESEKELTSEESLKLINRMIHEAKGYFHESGISAIVWGFSILACSLMAYAIERNIIILPFPPFYMLVPIFFVQAWIGLKENKKKKAKTFTDETIDYGWTGYFHFSNRCLFCKFCRHYLHVSNYHTIPYRLCNIFNGYDSKI